MGLRPGLAMLFLVGFLLLLAGAWSLSFYYPSQSLFYKFGAQKLLLRSGKLVGITGGLLLLVQLLAVAHLPVFEPTFSRATLLSFHRFNGLGLLMLCSHPILILWADDFAFYPLEMKYFPEFVGAALLLALVLLVLSAWFRGALPLTYPVWRWVHRLGALLVLALFFVHLLLVSETFHTGLPYRLALGLAGVEALLLALIFGRALFFGKGR